MSEDQTTELLVLGGGPGGYAAAFRAADLGLRVTLVDEEVHPGGVCLYRGCIPSKALLHVAKLVTEAREAKDWGVAFSEPQIDLDRLRAWKGEVVAKLTGGLGALSRARKITYVRGRGRLADAHSVEVEETGGGRRKIGFEKAILATGSSPVTLPHITGEGPRIMDSTAALDLPDRPERLLVIGGGYIGAELATVYAALGSKVTMVEMTDGLLPGVDRDLVKPLETRMKGVLDELLLGTRVTAVKETAKGLTVTVEGPDGSDERRADRLLVAVGRTPRSRGIGLENTGIRVDGHGFVEVDAMRRTAESHIFAIGDLAGQPLLAHKASHEGEVAAEVAAGKKAAFEPHAIPAVVFTDPEIAWCGITEAEAEAQGRRVAVGRFPGAASGRATTLGRSDGVTKVIADAQTGRVLGVGIAGPGAGELIAEGVLAVEMAAVAEDLALSIHPHPTLSETVMEAAEAIFGKSIHYLGR